MSTSDEMRRLVQAELAADRERQRDRRWSRAQTIGTWVIAVAAVLTLLLLHVL